MEQRLNSGIPGTMGSLSSPSFSNQLQLKASQSIKIVTLRAPLLLKSMSLPDVFETKNYLAEFSTCLKKSTVEMTKSALLLDAPLTDEMTKIIDDYSAENLVIWREGRLDHFQPFTVHPNYKTGDLLLKLGVIAEHSNPNYVNSQVEKNWGLRSNQELDLVESTAKEQHVHGKNILHRLYLYLNTIDNRNKSVALKVINTLQKCEEEKHATYSGIKHEQSAMDPLVANSAEFPQTNFQDVEGAMVTQISIYGVQETKAKANEIKKESPFIDWWLKQPSTMDGAVRLKEKLVDYCIDNPRLLREITTKFLLSGAVDWLSTEVDQRVVSKIIFKSFLSSIPAKEAAKINEDLGGDRELLIDKDEPLVPSQNPLSGISIEEQQALTNAYYPNRQKLLESCDASSLVSYDPSHGPYAVPVVYESAQKLGQKDPEKLVQLIKNWPKPENAEPDKTLNGRRFRHLGGKGLVWGQRAKIFVL